MRIFAGDAALDESPGGPKTAGPYDPPGPSGAAVSSGMLPALLLATAFAALTGRAGATPSAFEQLRSLAGPAVAPAAPPVATRTLPGPLATTDAVARLCGSGDPVLIVDNFVSEGVAPAIDVDGDETPDLEHGDVIEALYRAGGTPARAWNLKGRRDIPYVAETFARIARLVAKGRLRISAVNLSHTVEVPWQGLNDDLRLEVPATPENIAYRREELARAVSDLMTRNDSSGFADLRAAVTRLAALGVPIFLSAGNQTPAKVNLLGLLPGMVSVGALKRDGSKAAFSADNSLVTGWALGEHVFRRVPGGVDVDGDGRAEIPQARLSGGPAQVSRFAGRRLEEVRGRLPDDPWLVNIDRKTEAGLKYLQDRMTDGLYPVEELNDFFRVSKDKARSFASRGPYFDKTMRYPFAVDAAGRAVFDPAGDGSSGQVSLLPGTSFSAPAFCWRRR